MAKSPQKTSPNDDDILSDAEIAKRRDEGLRRLLKTPPKPHSEMVGKKGPPKKPRTSKAHGTR